MTTTRETANLFRKGVASELLRDLKSAETVDGYTPYLNSSYMRLDKEQVIQVVRRLTRSAPQRPLRWRYTLGDATLLIYLGEPNRYDRAAL